MNYSDFMYYLELLIAFVAGFFISLALMHIGTEVEQKNQAINDKIDHDLMASTTH